jgi:hypothetical protein
MVWFSKRFLGATMRRRVKGEGCERTVRGHLTYANVVSTLALVLVLGGGTAALASVIITSNSQVAQNTISGHHPPVGVHSNLIGGSVNGTDLATGSVTGGKLAANSVVGSKVIDGSLTGSDVQANSLTGTQINAGTLGEVPLAKIGGLGRFIGGQPCNPGANVIDCAITTINLPTASRVLLIGQANGYSENGNDYSAECTLVTNTGDVAGTRQDWAGSSGSIEPGAMVGITGVLPAGSHDFAVDCYDFGNTAFQEVGITAVAISPD